MAAIDICMLNDYSFSEYRSIVDKYTMNDSREINFQNRVVLRVLDAILLNNPDISVEDVSTQFKNKEVLNYHTRRYYAWTHTPDLLVVKNWNYANIDKGREDYIAVVEVKSPILDPISKDTHHTEEELQEYKEKCERVICTDCYRWRFYKKNKDITEYKEIILHDGEEWIMTTIKNDKFIQDEFGFPSHREIPENWDKLIDYLHAFLEV